MWFLIQLLLPHVVLSHTSINFEESINLTKYRPSDHRTKTHHQKTNNIFPEPSQRFFSLHLGPLQKSNLCYGMEDCLKLYSDDNISMKKSAMNATVISTILNDILDNYDKRLRPNHNGDAVVVTISFHIISLGISEMDMSYDLDCYFRQSWKDTRLRHDGPNESLAINSKILNNLWLPDTYFRNGLNSYLHTIPTVNKLIRLDKNGHLLLSSRITIRANCPMRLVTYPVDIQRCPLTIGSYGYAAEDVQYVWSDKTPINIEKGVQLSQFDLKNMTAKEENWTLNEHMYSGIMFEFALQRRTGYFILQIYMPCALIVSLSWVSFFINREATADRIQIGATCVLSLATITMDARNDIPKVSYLTALDWFFIQCNCYVCLSLLQFACVHFFTKVGYGDTFEPGPNDVIEMERYPDVRNPEHRFDEHGRYKNILDKHPLCPKYDLKRRQMQQTFDNSMKFIKLNYQLRKRENMKMLSSSRPSSRGRKQKKINYADSLLIIRSDRNKTKKRYNSRDPSGNDDAALFKYDQIVLPKERKQSKSKSVSNIHRAMDHQITKQYHSRASSSTSSCSYISSSTTEYHRSSFGTRSRELRDRYEHLLLQKTIPSFVQDIVQNADINDLEPYLTSHHKHTQQLQTRVFEFSRRELTTIDRLHYILKELTRCLLGDMSYKSVIAQRADPSGINALSSLDSFSQWFFPTSFIILQIFFWYLLDSDHH
ncbi:hypothetical protein SNEBB_007619 [Seison nebaliae]|nr:hypothetical protein SNEBB_007619 [Seison nebaliae]